METAGDVDWPRGANRGVGESSSGPHFQIAVAFAQADVDESCVFDGVVMVLILPNMRPRGQRDTIRRLPSPSFEKIVFLTYFFNVPPVATRAVAVKAPRIRAHV